MIGFTKNELVVFKKVTRNPKLVAVLVREAKMPRMTTYTILLRLEKRGLVKQSRIGEGKRTGWSRNGDSVLEKELSRTKKVLLGEYKYGDKNVLHGMTFCRGKKEIADTLMYLTTRQDGARMYSIQNASNWQTWIKIMGKEWVNNHNKAVVRHRLLVFTIHSPQAPEGIKSDKEVINAYKGRLGNSHSIPETFLRRNLSFYIFEDTIFLVNLETLEATLFTNHDLASFLIKMFMFMFEKGKEDNFFLEFNK